MADTIEDTDKEIETNISKITFLEIKIGLPDSKVIEEMNKLGLNKKYHWKEKVIGVWID